MTKIALVIAGVVVASVLLLICLFLVPIIYDGFRSTSQKRALQTRTDYPQIAAACVTLARATTNESVLLYPSQPIVPPLLRSLAPKYISAHTNFITLEFHGGFDHYGYRVRQSDTEPSQWTISFYTEDGEHLLTTITNN